MSAAANALPLRNGVNMKILRCTLMTLAGACFLAAPVMAQDCAAKPIPDHAANHADNALTCHPIPDIA